MTTSRTLGQLLVPLDADYGIPLRRAPDVRQACLEAYGPGEGPSVASMRAVLGLIGALSAEANEMDPSPLGEMKDG